MAIGRLLVAINGYWWLLVAISYLLVVVSFQHSSNMGRVDPTTQPIGGSGPAQRMRLGRSKPFYDIPIIHLQVTTLCQDQCTLQ